MRRHWWLWIPGGLLAIILLAVLVVLWMINTQVGTRSALNLVRSITGNVLQVRTVEGTLAGPLVLNEVKYTDAKSGLAFAAARVELDVAMRALFSTRVHIVNAELQGVDLALGTSTETVPEEPSEPFTFEAPIDLIIERFALRDAVVRRETQTLVQIDSADFAGSWLGRDLTIRNLDVQAPQGEIQFAGEIANDQFYAGEGKGRFRWQVEERRFEGTLQATAQNADSTFGINLSSPLRAKLDITLQQREALPWQFHLVIPSFDPRESLLPESSFQSLAADLRGEGTRDRGKASGEIIIDDESLRFEELTFAHKDDLLDLQARLALGGGALNANGHVQLAATPVAAKFDAQWDRITVPDRWVGQTLQTRGTMEFEGSSDAYEASGAVSLGPPERIADIEFRIEGSPAEIGVQQFDIVQKDGRLAVTGKLDLQPQIGWSLRAQAEKFNPGDFAIQWPGSLNFTLETEGAIEDAGPRARVALNQLRGQLRGRSLSGQADLALTTNKIVSGEANLRSGKSRLQLKGTRADAMDAVASIDIPALDDWLPNGGGELHGQFSARGVWPDIAIEGNARGRSLRYEDLRAEALRLSLNVTNPTNPNGSAHIEISDAVAAGMEIASLKMEGSGSNESHSLQLSMSGSPVGTELLLEGSRSDTGWSGTMEKLVLDIENAARLTLQKPVQIRYSAAETSISETCFADGDIRLCLDGTMRADGLMRANYSLREVPLALANAFASASSPIVLAGTINGEGHMQRDAAGAFSGTARLQSSPGHIAHRVSNSEETDILMRFDDIDLVAALETDRARATIRGRLDETGSINGELQVAGLSQPSSNLDGSLAVSLPSLAVVELFVPQLASVAGRLDLKAAVRGSMDEPDITGQLSLTNLEAQVPEYGLQLNNGRVVVTPRPDNAFDLEGGIQSGDGALAFAGIVRAEGTSTISVNGKDFLAADTPGARVIIAPDLAIERTTERVTINGQVRIPTATINLQELPKGQGGRQRASSDVVIIDATTQEEAQAEGMAVFANVNVIVGDKVELAGFGLLAQVNGQLTVHERPGEPTSGSGEIRVSGTYKAYGQDLTIREGRLLYASTPLDNPNLNLTAVRIVEEVTAGIRVTGSAKSPVLTVFSDPPMAQSNALSYLVAGKPIDEIRESEGEGDALQSAARSLGTAAGGLLAKNLGKRLGIDELGIKENEMIGGSAFTIGQYLSPRLYLSYGVGLFEPGEVITLRYKLSEAFAVQAQSGSEESRAGIQYRIER